MVEPLVGHLRHPYAVPACQPGGVVVSTQLIASISK